MAIFFPIINFIYFIAVLFFLTKKLVYKPVELSKKIRKNHLHDFYFSISFNCLLIYLLILLILARILSIIIVIKARISKDFYYIFILLHFYFHVNTGW